MESNVRHGKIVYISNEVILMNFMTRLMAVEAVKKCDNWPDLFDTMKKALSSQRASWGDRDKYLMFAATEWTMTTFFVASPRVFHLEHRRLEGQVISQGAFKMAREMAVELLGPLKKEEDWSGPNGMMEKIGNILYGDRCKEIHDEINLSFLQGGLLVGNDHLNQNFALNNAYTVSPKKVAQLQQSFVYDSVSMFRDYPELDDYLEHQLYQGQPVKGSIEKNTQDSNERLSPEELTELCEDFGFTHLRLGPLGGWDGACKAVHQMDKAAYGLAQFIQAPATVVGQNLIGCSLNEPRVGTIAYFRFPLTKRFYSCRAPVIGFTTGVQSLGHEWTHAMEYFNIPRLKERSAMTLAYGKLHPRIESLPQDPVVCAQYLLQLEENMKSFLQTLRQKLVDGLRDYGTFALKKNAEINNDVPPEIWDQYKAILERGRTEKREDLAVELKNWKEGLGRIFPDEVENSKWELDAYALRSDSVDRQKVLLKQGKPVFLVDAWEGTVEKRWTIGQRNKEIEYYMRPHELLARASESIFHSDEYPGLGFVGEKEYSSPKGEEVSYIRPYYEAWLAGIRENWLTKLEVIEEKKKLKTPSL